MTDFISPVRCMVTIVDRGKGDRVVDLCRGAGTWPCSW